MKTRRDIFQAIADPTRRALIFLLATQALTPNDLAQHFQTSRQAVSKHLQILIECEVVKPVEQGREIYYHIHVDKMKEVEKWLEAFQNLMKNRFDQLDHVLSTLKHKKP